MGVPIDLHDVDDDIDDRPFADINVTPLVDVMLVLLVVFMMAAPLMVHGVPIDLPKGAGTSLGHPTKPLLVSLAKDGGFYVRDERVDPAALPERLKALRAAEGDAIVYVRADRGIPYGDVMDVIGRLGTGGFTHVSLLSEAGRAPTP